MNMDIDLGALPLGGARPIDIDIDCGDMDRHELFDELDAVNPRWREEFPTLPKAAAAYGLLETFQDFLRTPDGERYLRTMAGVRDWQAQNERARRQREAEIEMANRSAAR